MNELSQKQVKGVDIAVKGSSKKFPFVKDWKLTDDYKEYKSNLYIDILVDWQNVKKYFDFEFNPIFDDYEIKNLRTNTLGVLFLPSYTKNSPEFEEKIEKSFKIKMEIERSINNIYSNLPQDYQIIWESEYTQNKKVCSIKVSEFLTLS